jgi:hypothetical protein
VFWTLSVWHNAHLKQFKITHFRRNTENYYIFN